MTKKPQQIIIKEKGQPAKQIEKTLLNASKKFKKISLAGQLVLIEHDPEGKQDADLSFKKEVFCRWYVLPGNDREPSGLMDFCQALGISHQTPYNWLEDGAIQSMIEQYRREYMRRDTTEVLTHLKARIRQYGRAQDVKLWLEYIEGWIPTEQQIQDQQINVIFKGINRPTAGQEPAIEGQTQGNAGQTPDPSPASQTLASEPQNQIPGQTTPDKKAEQSEAGQL